MVFALAGDSTITSVPERGRLALGFSPSPTSLAATIPSSCSSSPSASARGSWGFCLGAAFASSGRAVAAGVALPAALSFTAGFFSSTATSAVSSTVAAAVFSLAGFLAGAAFAAGAFLVATMHLESTAGAAENPTFQFALGQKPQHLAETPPEPNGHLFGGHRPLIEQVPQSRRVLRV